MAQDNYTVGKPDGDMNQTLSLPEDSIASFDFTSADIQGMSLTTGGELVISFTDGGTLTIDNFQDLAANNIQIAMQDGKLISFHSLYKSLAADMPAIDLAQPGAGVSLVYELQPGGKYNFAANASAVSDIRQEDGALIIGFDDQGQIVLQNFQDAMEFEIPVEISHEEGFVSLIEFFDNLQLLLAMNEEMREDLQPELREEAAGEEDLAQLAEELAQVEPAAGEGPGGTRGGFGFQSGVDAAPFGAPPAIGPIGPTALQFDLPEPQDPLFIQEQEGAAPLPPPLPDMELSDQQVYEDGSVEIFIFADSNAGLNVAMTLEISGIPAGWGVDANGGTYDSGAGIWTFNGTAGQTSFTAGPVLFPPADSDVDLPGLDVTLTNTDAGTGLSSNITGSFDVTTDAVADTPDLTANDSMAHEDNPADIDISTAVTDTDGSEEITTIYVRGVPAGFTLSAGTDNGGGEWELDQADLAGLQITPPADYFGTITLAVESVAEEVNKTDADFDLTNDEARAFDDLEVTWKPVIDPPDVLANNGADDAQVKEDGSVDVPVVATLNSVDSPDAFLTVTVTGFDPSWGTVSNTEGTFNGAGTEWTITLPANTNLSTVFTFTPEAQSDIDLTGFQVTAVATEPATGTSASATDSFNVIVDAVADDPGITASGDSGAEGATLDVDISGALGVDDFDGSESIVEYVISGVPAEITFNQGTNNLDGTWTFTPAELTGLTATPNDPQFSETLTLTATIFTTENPVSDGEFDTSDNNNQASADFVLDWQPVIDPPGINVNNGAEGVPVKEDGTVDVRVEAALAPGGDTDEFLTVEIAGIPSEWGFSAPIGTYDVGTGIWSVTLPAGQALDTTLTFMPPAESDVDLTGLIATATATDPSEGISADATDSFNIIVDAVADTPAITANGGAEEEGTPIDIDISGMLGSDDFDGSESIDHYEISGLPLSGFSFNQGSNLGGGVWSFTPAELSGLQLIPADPAFEGQIDLTATIFTVDTPTDGEFDVSDNTAQASADFSVKWLDNDQPVLVQPETVSVDETDLVPTTSVSDSIQADFGDDTPGSFAGNGSFFIGTITSNGDPVSVNFDAATNTYTGVADGDDVFTLVLQANGDYTFTLLGTLDHPEADDHNDSLPLEFGVTAEDSNGDTTDGVITVNVFDDGLTANDDFNMYNVADGGADGNVISGLNGGTGAEDDLSNDVPNNVIEVSYGATAVIVPESGSATIDGTYGTLEMFSDGTYEYTLFTTDFGPGAHEFNETLEFPELIEGQEISGDALDNLGINPGALTLAAGGTGTATFISEGAGFNNTFGSFRVAADGTIETADILIKNTNAGFGNGDMVNFNVGAGESIGFFIIADGYDVNGFLSGLDLSGGTLAFVNTATGQPATISDDGANVRLVFTETATGTETVFDGPIYFTTERGSPDNLNADDSVRVVSGLADGADNETLRIGFEDLPNLGDKDFEDFIFDVSFDLFDQPDCLHDEFTYVMQDGDGDTSTAILELKGKFPPVETEITVNDGVDNVIVKEDGSVFVDVDASYSGGNGNEVLTLTLTGVAASWGFSGGGWAATGNPGEFSLTLPAGQQLYNGGFTLIPPADSDIDLSGLSVTASLSGPDAGDSASASDDFNVIVDAVADTPDLSAEAASGEEGTTISLDIATAVTDTDGSETIKEVKISNLPPGSSLTAGTESGGVWTLDVADLAGLGLVVPDGITGTFTLNIESVATEAPVSDIEDDFSDNEASAFAALSVKITPDDVPVVSPITAGTDEDAIDEATATIEGTLNADFGDDTPGSFSGNGSFSASGSLLGGTLQSKGEPVTVNFNGTDTFTGTADGRPVFTLVIDNDGSYTFTLLDQLDHADGSDPDDIIALEFGWTATDSEGDSTSSVLTINVIDDVPVANDDSEDAADTASVTGNVTDNDLTGADEDVTVTKVTFDGNETNVPGTGTVTVNGTYGALEIAASGVYTYTVYGGADGTDVFTYTLRDYDGDTDTANLTINVDVDDQPKLVDPAPLKVDETGLSAGDIVVSDTIGADFGNDGPGTYAGNGSFNFSGSVSGGALTSNGVAVTVAQAGAGYIGTAAGETIFTLEIDETTGEYDFTLFGTLDHADGANPDDVINLEFGFDATDSDGDAANGTITVDVLDDGVSAQDDMNDFDAQAQDVVTGNVLVNDDLSQDTPNNVTHVAFGQNQLSVPQGGSASIEGGNGTLMIDSEGNYEYVLFDQPVQPPAEKQTVYSFSKDNPPGSDSGGNIKNVSTSLNTGTNEFTFSLTIADPSGKTSEGFTVALNDGPNPKGHPAEMALFYFDNSSGTPVVTVYGYNGQNTQTSWQDGSDASGTQAPDQIVSSLAADNPFTSVESGTDVHGNHVFSFTMDAGVVLEHDPLYGDGSEWTGMAFAEKLGIWLHPVADLSTSYDADGFLTSWNPSSQGWFDATDLPTEITEICPCTAHLDPVAGDIGSYQTSLVKDGITVSVGEPLYDYLDTGYLSWVSTSDVGEGIGIKGNGSSKVWKPGEVLEIGFEQHAGKVQLKIADIGSNNLDDGIDFKVYLDDGTAESYEFDIAATAPVDGMIEIELNAADFGDGSQAITQIDVFSISNSDLGTSSFLLNNVWAECFDQKPVAGPVDVFDYMIADSDGDSAAAQLFFNGGKGETLVGGTGDDSLSGTALGDLLAGGAGSDTLFGDAGADVFLFQDIGEGVDTITDFNSGEGDMLDLTLLLQGSYDETSHAIGDFVIANDNGTDTTISVDPGGNGDAAAATALVTLQGVSGYTAEELMQQTNLVA